MAAQKKFLVLYQGGTIGMVRAGTADGLAPRPLEDLRAFLPELDRLGCAVDFRALGDPIDSSNVQVEDWGTLAREIGQAYANYDGFLVLHGTDTMAFTASALSFQLENLRKPVLLTGAVLPIDIPRSDARENVILALQILTEVCEELYEVGLVFDGRLYRGNRTIKYSSQKFHAFVSPNYPPLAEAGFALEYDKGLWLRHPSGPFWAQETLDPHVALVKFYPGLLQAQLESTVAIPGLRGLVLETFGNGNLPGFAWLRETLGRAIANGVVVVNVTQCTAGEVNQMAYAAGRQLEELGVISGRDMTTAAALTKLMYLHARYPDDTRAVRTLVAQSLRGEIAPA